jgi:hypothetical protein
VQEETSIGLLGDMPLQDARVAVRAAMCPGTVSCGVHDRPGSRRRLAADVCAGTAVEDAPTKRFLVARSYLLDVVRYLNATEAERQADPSGAAALAANVSIDAASAQTRLKTSFGDAPFCFETMLQHSQAARPRGGAAGAVAAGPLAPAAAASARRRAGQRHRQRPRGIEA